MMRLLNPSAEIRVGAGREQHLGPLQAMALWPANSLFMDGYLLTRGDDAEATLRMIIDAGFAPELDGRAWPEHMRALVADASRSGSDALDGEQGRSSKGPAPLKETVMKQQELS
jgi:biotin synthase